MKLFFEKRLILVAYALVLIGSIALIAIIIAVIQEQSGPDPLAPAQTRAETVGSVIPSVEKNIAVVVEPIENTGIGPVWLIVVTVLSLGTTLVAVAVTFYLYRWRRILLAEHPNALVPEEWGAALKESSKTTKILVSKANENNQTLTGFLQQHSDNVRQMTETFMTFKKSLDDKDAEIERLRRGYDAHVYRQFLSRFIRVHKNLLECASEAVISVSDIRNLRLLLEDAMEESGVAAFEPDVGEDIRGLGDRVAENPKILETDDPAAHLTIATVNAPGYEIVSGEQTVILSPAQVTVYSSSNTAEEE
jgi:hypothetical protein